MANLAYFADLDDGSVLEFRATRERSYVDRSGCQRYRDIPAKVWFSNGATWGAGADGAPVKITRTVEMKSLPSRHECDSRCMNATGRVMKCECACGGKNHGRGAFVCVEG